MKTDSIIRMVNLPLGTFEYNKDSDSVTCSEILLKLIDISVEKGTIIDSQLFFQRIEEIKKNVEDEQNNIYMVSNNTNRWIKLVFVERENTIWGIGMDATKEVLDNHANQIQRKYGTF